MAKIALKRGNKYRAQKANCQHGHTHDSKKEARRCAELHLLQRAGQISDLEQQPQFWFAINGVPVMHLNGRRVGYRPDFAYIEAGRRVAEDAKGMCTPDYVLRAAFFRALFPDIELREV